MKDFLGKHLLSTGLALLLFAGGVGYLGGYDGETCASAQETVMDDKVVKSDEEWRKTLTSEQYDILRKKGTERPFTGKYDKWKEKGVFVCAACRNPLFSSEHKFDSGTGWPSYWQPYSDKSVLEAEDNSWFGKRIEILCRRCDGHLGHVFNDGPPPTGLRYCINSGAMDFEKKDK